MALDLLSNHYIFSTINADSCDNLSGEDYSSVHNELSPK